jgi:hypothetical protein
MEEPGLASANPGIIQITEYNEIRSPVGILSICGELGSTLVNKTVTNIAPGKTPPRSGAFEYLIQGQTRRIRHEQDVI